MDAVHGLICTIHQATRLGGGSRGVREPGRVRADCIWLQRWLLQVSRTAESLLNSSFSQGGEDRIVRACRQIRENMRMISIQRMGCNPSCHRWLPGLLRGAVEHTCDVEHVGLGQTSALAYLTGPGLGCLSVSSSRENSVRVDWEKAGWVVTRSRLVP